MDSERPFPADCRKMLVWEDQFFQSEVDFATGNYHVLHVRPRAEKKVTVALENLDRPHFLPLYHKQMERRSGAGRTRRYASTVPLFPGYVFAWLEQSDIDHPPLMAYVAQVIAVTAAERHRFLTQLTALRMALASPYSVEPFEYLKEGVDVVVTGGALRGIEGRVVRRGDDRVFVIQIDLVGRAVEIPVEASFLKPMG